jgi:hypothetical protein
LTSFSAVFFLTADELFASSLEEFFLRLLVLWWFHRKAYHHGLQPALRLRGRGASVCWLPAVFIEHTVVHWLLDLVVCVVEENFVHRRQRTANKQRWNYGCGDRRVVWWLS